MAGRRNTPAGTLPVQPGPQPAATVPVPDDDRSGRLVEQLSYQVAAGFALLYLLARLIAVSDRDPSTALAFLAASGIASTVAGAALQFVPLLFFFMAGAATLLAMSRSGLPRDRWRPYLFTAVGAWALVLVTVPSPLAPHRLVSLLAYGGVALALVVGAVHLVCPRHAWARQAPWVLAAVVVAVALLQVQLDRTVWIAPERITVAAVAGTRAVADQEEQDDEDDEDDASSALRSGTTDAVYLGYVLRSDDSWTTVLLEDPRTVLTFATDRIRARTVCTFPQARPAPPAADRLFDALRDDAREGPVTPSCSG